MPDIYEARQETKELRDKYRAFVEHNAHLFTDPVFPGKEIVKISMQPHAHTMVMEDGAFVEVMMWVPKANIE